MSHTIFSSYDMCTVSYTGFIDENGNFETNPEPPTVDDIDGETALWCLECEQYVHPNDGVHGLSEDWQSV